MSSKNKKGKGHKSKLSDDLSQVSNINKNNLSENTKDDLFAYLLYLHPN